jgi:hypothetical protein
VRWGEVLTFIRSLQPVRQPPAAERPIVSGADLGGSDLIGIWADRTTSLTVASSPGSCGGGPNIGEAGPMLLDAE